MPLTDTAVRNAKPRAKQAKLSDERGLFLIVTPAGGKWWRFRYSFDARKSYFLLASTRMFPSPAPEIDAIRRGNCSPTA